MDHTSQNTTPSTAIFQTLADRTIAPDQRVENCVEAVREALGLDELVVSEVCDDVLLPFATAAAPSITARSFQPAAATATLASIGAVGVRQIESRHHPLWTEPGSIHDAPIQGVDSVLGLVSGRLASAPNGAPDSAQEVFAEFALRLAPFLERRHLARTLRSASTDPEWVLSLQREAEVGREALAVRHDMNNMLTTVRGAMQFLDGKTEKGPQTEILNHGNEALRHFSDLIHDLSEPSTGDCREADAITFDQFLTDNEPLLRAQLGEGINLSLQLGTAESRIHGRPVQLSQILLNLGSNARDALGGRGAVQIATTRLEVDGKSWVRLRFGDDGPGMADEIRDRIFEPKFSTKGPGAGSGLGLVTVNERVHVLGGRIAVESEPGRGTVFEILLPAAD
ncbi:MAG: ATP-binding protein [Planctomycetota bacterium]